MGFRRLFVPLVAIGIPVIGLAAVIGFFVVTVARVSVNPTLIQAAERDDRATVERMLRQGADLNAKDLFGTTALIRAAMQGHVEMMRWLLDHGANINGRDGEGRAALHQALQYKQVKAAQLLIERGADVNVVASPDLSTTVTVGSGSFVRSHTVYVATLNNTTTSYTISGNGNIVVTGGNLKGSPYSASPLMIAAEQGLTDCIRQMLARGANVNWQNGAGTTALLEAVRNGRKNAATLLIEAGADVNVMDTNKQTPLLAALENGNYAIALLLLGHDAKANTKDVTGLTPLDYAIAYLAANKTRTVELVQKLLDAGAGRPSQWGGEDSAEFVTQAVASKNRPLVEILLKAGASVEPRPIKPGQFRGRMRYFRDGRANSPLESAVEANQPELVALLLTHGANPNRRTMNQGSALQQSISYGNLKIVNLLLTHGANPNVRDRQGQTPLVEASSSDRPGIVEALLAHDADPDAADRQGMTPLMTAAGAHNPTMVRILLAHGAKVNAKNRYHQTALGSARSSYDRKAREVARLLRAAGAER